MTDSLPNPQDNQPELPPGGAIVPRKNSLPQRVEQHLGLGDSAMAFKQSPSWSRAILWTLVGLTTFGVIYACVAKIDESVVAQGKLEPKVKVKPIQVPLGGVVKEVLVQDGDVVREGQLLAILDTTAARAKSSSLTSVQQKLEAENRLYRAQLGEGSGGTLSVDQQRRLLAAQSEFRSRQAAASQEIAQQQQQLQETEAQLRSNAQSLAVNERILRDIEPLFRQGGMSRVQYYKQEEQVSQLRSEGDRLRAERAKILETISQAREKLINTQSLTQSELREKIDDNEKQLDDIRTQLSESQLTLKYQNIKAPVAGTVFDLKAGPGFVANSSEPILKLVPRDNLVARVFITNRDIGFVRPPMPVDVRIDAFPYSEFGDVKGQLTEIGSDALAPDETYKFFRFPATIRLNQQTLMVRGRPVNLQSGMSVTANIKIRQRPVISILTDLFMPAFDSLKTIR